MPQPDEPEQALIRRANRGDADAFGELITRHHRSALRIATVVLGTATGADDVVQEAAVRAWRACASIDPDRSFRNWYLTVVTNTARNGKRAFGRRAALEVRQKQLTAAQEHFDPADAAVISGERTVVVNALNRMSTSERTIIALRYFEQLSERETAEVLGCRLGTVKSRQARAMSRLRIELLSANDLGSDDGPRHASDVKEDR